MSDQSQLAQQQWPYFRWIRNRTFPVGNSQLVVDGRNWPGAASIVDTIDLLDNTLATGDNAILLLGAADGTTTLQPFFRGYTYASSQGYYPWRGQLLLLDGEGLWINTDVGNWTVTVSGVMLPDAAVQN